MQVCPSIGQKSQFNALQKAGFYFADLRVELDLLLASSNLGQQGGARQVVAAGLHDLEALQAIACSIYRHSRFRAQGLDGRQADELHSTWVTEAVTGRFDDCCQIIRVDDTPLGFIALRFDTGASKARISLLGVSPHFQGDGVG